MKKYFWPVTVSLGVWALTIHLGISWAIAGDETVHVSAFDLPVSALMSEEDKVNYKRSTRYLAEISDAVKACPDVLKVEVSAVSEARSCIAEAFFQTNYYRELKKEYPVEILETELGGVPVEIFTPKDGVAEQNAERVLINLHGGGFISGERYGTHMESIPIASLGRFKVVGVNYRMAPEHTFPSASIDTTAVYKDLLKHYKPGNIGIYGCSAGAVLTAQSIAWFQKEGLQIPGAVGMFCAAASRFGGDSAYISGAISGQPHDAAVAITDTYWGSGNRSNPLVAPAESDEILSKFPPSLLISSTRDSALSSVIHTHRQLVRLGVEAELQLWEGVGHGHPFVPGSSEVHEVIVRFFNKHLGRKISGHPHFKNSENRKIKS